MNKFLSIIFLLTSVQTFGQFDYELFKQYADKTMIRQNKNLNSITELRLLENKSWIKTTFQQFNAQGLPTVFIQYNEQNKEAEKKEFVYDSNGRLTSIESYKEGKHEGTAEFEVNGLGEITAYTDYGYSSLSGEKIFVWKTLIEYNPNQTLKKKIKLQGFNKDTVEINYYDTIGSTVKTIQNQSGLRTTKIEYIWNGDKSELKELHYENDTSVYTTIVHKYKGGKEIEKIDPSTSPKPFYWKYDDKGRVIETNEAFFYIVYFVYDEEGRLSKKTMNVLFSDSDEKDLPKKFYFKYTYSVRL